MRALFRQFSFPGGIPSHVAPETPGSIHEGGEPGYAPRSAHFDNPDLLVACVVGDGEAETGPLATGWHSNKFLSAKTDGAVPDPPPERLQDREPDRPRAHPRTRARRTLRRLRLLAAACLATSRKPFTKPAAAPTTRSTTSRASSTPREGGETRRPQ
jgi:hypothetical protein